MNVDEVETVAVLGAGTMGHGIAEVAALSGRDVTLRDVDREPVESGYERIEWSLGKLVENGQVSERAADAALRRVEPLVALESAVADADVVIEAVPERMESKTDVYDDLSEHAPEHAVFVSNTSSLSITELAQATGQSERFCGMHFFNPPVQMQLVEVVRGEATTEATLDLIETLAESMGKTPIRVRKDEPGFIVNRVVVPLMNEAAWIVEAGDGTVAAVDATATDELGLPTGPFELADNVGIDVMYHVLEYMHEELGDAYEPSPLIEAKVETGQLGRKSGTGFYDHEDGGASIPEDAGSAELADRLLAVAANEVAALVSGDVAAPPAIDRAVELGAGFPQGPARLADAAGIEPLVSTLDQLRERTGAERYEVARLLRDLAVDDRDFHGAESAGDDAAR